MFRHIFQICYFCIFLLNEIKTLPITFNIKDKLYTHEFDIFLIECLKNSLTFFLCFRSLSFWPIMGASVMQAELMDLQLEKIQKTDEGLLILCRCKQRTDKRDSRYLVPNGGPAEVVSSYIKSINDDLGVFSGRVFYRGNHIAFFNTLISKNLVSKVPVEVAQLLKRENPNMYIHFPQPPQDLC